MGTKRSKPTVRQLRETTEAYDAPPEDALSMRERALVAGMLNGKSQTQAAIDAGYSAKSAASIGSRALARINNSQSFSALLAKAGLDDATLANAIRQGATESLEYGLSRSGESVPLGPAWHARAKFVDMALKVGKHYPDRTVDVQVTGAVVVKAATDAAPDPFAVIEGEYQVQE